MINQRGPKIEDLHRDSSISTHRSMVEAAPVSFPGDGKAGGLSTLGLIKQDRPGLPLVTVITVVKNAAAMIRETLSSVLVQTYGNLELIVVDGGSSDGTLEIIREQEKNIDLWLSGHDSGIYDAMNIAVGLARGRYVHFLNAGDHFTTSRVVEIVVDRFREKECRWVHGNVLMLNKATGLGWIRYSNVSRYYYLFKGIPQQAFFFEKALFDESGGFNTSYPIVADLDFLLRTMIDRGIRGAYLNMPVVVFDTGGISGDMKKKEKERMAVLREHFPAWSFIFLKNNLFHYLLVRNESRYRKKSILEKMMSRF